MLKKNKDTVEKNVCRQSDLKNKLKIQENTGRRAIEKDQSLI